MTVSIKKSILEDIRTGPNAFLIVNIISTKSLQSFAGELNNVAGLLSVFRPSLQPIWASIYTTTSNAPANTVWARHLFQTLHWPQVFMKGLEGGITRRFDLKAYLRKGPRIEIGTDASPFGLGGWISKDGIIFQHFSSPITADHRRIYIYIYI